MSANLASQVSLTQATEFLAALSRGGLTEDGFKAVLGDGGLARETVRGLARAREDGARESWSPERIMLRVTEHLTRLYGDWMRDYRWIGSPMPPAASYDPTKANDLVLMVRLGSLSATLEFYWRWLCGQYSCRDRLGPGGFEKVRAYAHGPFEPCTLEWLMLDEFKCAGKSTVQTCNDFEAAGLEVMAWLAENPSVACYLASGSRFSTYFMSGLRYVDEKDGYFVPAIVTNPRNSGVAPSFILEATARANDKSPMTTSPIIVRQ